MPTTAQRAQRPVLVLCLMLSLATAAANAAAFQIPRLDWPGKRSDWINVKTDVTPAAIGNGIADDTRALQAALDMVSDDPGKAKTVYLPPGAYRITATIAVTQHHHFWLVGHGDSTTILWDGAADASSIMFWSNGAGYARYEGIVFDGNNKAGVGIDHTSKGYFETEIDHRHCAFRNLTTAGTRVGKDQVQASAEQTFVDCLFDNCRIGCLFLTWNDYDEMLDGCDFSACSTGVWINNGANSYIRNCHFEQSLGNDIYGVGPEHPCSIKRCSSLNSNRFLTWVGGVATVFIEDCNVSGWTSAAGAMDIGGPPIVMFDCKFSNPPLGATQCVKAHAPLVLSANTVPAGMVLTTQTDTQEIPPGRLSGSLSAASRSFLRTAVDVPQKVYDVKTLGAKGDGSADDATAIQAAIDSARIRGSGAIAYLPRGTYKVSKTINIGGANFRVGGSGFESQIWWGGAAGGVVVSVVDPKNVTVQQLSVGGPNDSVDIRQTGADGSSSIRYDMVQVYGMYMRKPFDKGLQFLGLPKGATVVAEHLEGNVRVTNSSRATILTNSIWEGALTVEGAQERVRDGFLGVVTRFNSNEPYGLYVKNNQNIVMTDYYTEGTARYWSISGGTGDPAGHVTIAGIKVNTDSTPVISIDNYGGRIAAFSLQHYLSPDPREIRQTGTQPLNLLFVGNKSYDPQINVTTSSTTTLTLIQNAWSGPADTIPRAGLQAAADALDDFRQLGALDLQLNHPPESVAAIGDRGTRNPQSGPATAHQPGPPKIKLYALNGRLVGTIAAVNRLPLTITRNGVLIWQSDGLPRKLVRVRAQ